MAFTPLISTNYIMNSQLHNFIAISKARGYFHDCTDEEGLTTLLANQTRAYIGFDLTADSLHVGSLLPIMLLRLFQKCGHQPLILIGSGTTKIGDPSGKDETRPLQTNETITHNAQKIEKIFKTFLSFEGKNKALIRYNHDWLDGLNYIAFLREVGKHFSVNKMLQAESVKRRLERAHNLSFLEFNYMLVQAYDFYQLAKHEDCWVQMGGSDQWGNITAGIDLGRRMKTAPLYGLTTPLLETSTGTKMGKTAQGAIWLNEDKCSVWDYWQFWRNCHDRDVAKFLKLFTELSLQDITDIMEGDINEAKKQLATHATSLAHGADKAQTALKTAQDMFEGDASSNAFDFIVSINSSQEERSLIHILRAAEIVTSKSEARRLIRGGAITLKGEKIKDENFTFAPKRASHPLTIGKRRFLTIICE